MFIASDVKASPEIESLARSLFNQGNLKVTDLNNLHLTYLFLGDINKKESDRISTELEKINSNKISAKICGITAFPDNVHPRVIAMVLESPYLYGIYNSIIHLFPEYKQNNMKFIPHITIARNRRSSSKPNISGLSMLDGILLIDNVCLFKSNLTQKGPIYERIICNKFQ